MSNRDTILLVVKFLAGNTILAGRGKYLKSKFWLLVGKLQLRGWIRVDSLKFSVLQLTILVLSYWSVDIKKSPNSDFLGFFFFGCFQFTKGQFILLLPFLPSGPCVVLPFLCPLWLTALPSKVFHLLYLWCWHTVFPCFLFASQLSVYPVFVCAQAANLPDSTSPESRERAGLAGCFGGGQVSGTGPQLVGLQCELWVEKGCREDWTSFAKLVIAYVVTSNGPYYCWLECFVIKLIAIISCHAITP